MATRKTATKASTAKKVTPAKKVTTTSAKAKKVAAKATAHRKENKQEVKSLKIQQECQEMMGSSRKDTKARLAELKEAQAKLRAEAKALREAAKSEKAETAVARKALAAHKKAIRAEWTTVRTNVGVFRTALKNETDLEAMEQIAQDLRSALATFTDVIGDAADSKSEILDAANGLVDEDELGDDEEL